MSGDRGKSAFRRLRALVGPAGIDAEPDHELLRRYADRDDQAAFAALVRRHGAMIWGVCRRALPSAADAEDAFQAAFLLLARKAGSLGRRESIRGWLYVVARRLAVRSATGRRPPPTPPAHLAHAARPGPADELSWREVRVALDEELARLPAQHRAAVLLCCLEGLTRDEAAKEIGCPVGTLRSRLDRGRELLQKRLVCRGITLSAALGSAEAARGAVPPILIIRAACGEASPRAISLAREALTAMTTLKVKGLVAAAVAALTVGTALALQPPPAGPPPAAPAAKAPAPNPAIADTARGRVEFIGLTRQTAAQVLKRAADAAPDGKLQLCAPCLKSAGFADVAPAFFVGDDGKTVYTVVTVVEKEDAARVRYRPVPPEADAVPIPGWADGLPAARDSMLLQAAVQTYGHFLDGQPEKARDVAKYCGQDPAKLAAVWEFLKVRAKPADRDLAAWAVAQHGDPAHRSLAAAILMNFPESDLTWWLLADAQRDPHGIVASTAGHALGLLAKDRPRTVDWRPAGLTLRALLAGTNLFAYLATLDLLVATKVSPDLAPVLLAESDLLRAYLKAEHAPSRSKAEAFARHLGAEDIKDAAGWDAWLDRFRPKTGGPGR